MTPGEQAIQSETSSESMWMQIVCWVFIIAGLSVISGFNYLLFHGLAEMFSIVIACGIFMLAWNTRRFQANAYLVLLGIAYLFIGGFDLLHTLAYKGMGVFIDAGANLPTQLWIAARYLESISLLAAPFFCRRRIRPVLVMGVFTAVTGLAVLSLFVWRNFPVCFVKNSGLTAFKIGSEYVISAFLLCSLALLHRQRKELNPAVLRLVMWSIIMTVASELAFTFYISVYGLSNLVGHLLKIGSFYLIYRAIIQTGLRSPFDLLFVKLKRREEELQRERDALKEAYSRLKVLSGLLPICCKCKKIRDDKGYWNKLEIYISSHSEADFTHGICPDCAHELYPDVFPEKNGEEDGATSSEAGPSDD